tara:strand:- start:174 stop:320 length:147 start_codon:yes stop_codon:yes gene_type:complete
MISAPNQAPGLGVFIMNHGLNIKVDVDVNMDVGLNFVTDANIDFDIDV